MNFHPCRCRLILLVLILAIVAAGQESTKTDALPKEIRGYKIHRARVELKKPNEKSGKDEYDEDEPLLIRLGEAQLVSATPLGVTFDVPVVLAAVKQQGDVDRLVFEDMIVNDTPVSIEDYVHPFKLPNKEPLSLAPPVRIFVSTPQALLRTVDDILSSKEVWQVSGRIYVCGHFKKYLAKFKRAVPVEVQTSINNPLK